MRSKAQIKGHPIHPMLIPFPLAFLVGGFGFNIAGICFDDQSLWRTGGYLAIAGIITALAAAIPGLIDYTYTVPPNSTGKKRATKHMLLNLTAVALFAVTVWLRAQDTAMSLVQPAIQLVAVGMLSVAGWMGGVLVGRNQISVDHRYAGAGKWRDETIDGAPGESVKVGKADELEVNQMKLLRTSVGRLVLARTESGWCAFDDRCTHRGGSLAGGALICGTVQCPWHGSQFDVESGAVTAGPAFEPISSYAVEERDGALYIKLPISKPGK